MELKQKQLVDVNHIVIGKSLVIGFFGGVFLVVFFGIMHYFSITEIDVFKPWKALFKQIKWPVKWYMYPLWIIAYGFISTIPALIYFLIGKNRNHWDIGALYGFALAVLGYILLPNLLWDYHVLQLYAWKTHLSMFVLFIIYGMFIGYSISYEYGSQLEALQEKK